MEKRYITTAEIIQLKKSNTFLSLKRFPMASVVQPAQTSGALCPYFCQSGLGSSSTTMDQNEVWDYLNTSLELHILQASWVIYQFRTVENETGHLGNKKKSYF